MEQNKVDEKVMTLVHFARKSGKLVIGYDAVRRSVESGHSILVLIANDLEKGRQRSMRFLCEQSKVQLRLFSDKNNIGIALNTRDVGIVSIEDRNLARGAMKYLDQ